MFKYLQRFAFIKEDIYAFKAFQEKNLAIDGWVNCMKTKLELLGLGNLMANIYKVMGKSRKKNTGQNMIFFQKQAADSYLKNQFIDNENDRGFFTQLKQTYEKERY